MNEQFYYKIARRAASRIPGADREDAEQDIVLAIPELGPRASQLPDAYFWRLARNIVVSYWRSHNIRDHQSLDKEIELPDGERVLLSSLMPGSDRVEDRAAASITLETLPLRIKKMAEKMVNGQPLSGADRVALHRFRRKAAG